MATTTPDHTPLAECLGDAAIFMAGEGRPSWAVQLTAAGRLPAPTYWRTEVGPCIEEADQLAAAWHATHGTYSVMDVMVDVPGAPELCTPRPLRTSPYM